MGDESTARDRYKKVSTALGALISGPQALMVPAPIKGLLGEAVLLLGELVERIERLEKRAGTD